MNAAAQTLDRLETPCLVADRSRIAANAARMRQGVASSGVRLRPHAKTVKSADIASMAHGGAAGPLTVSTLGEADYFLDRGFADLTYAVCITPNKLAHAANVVGRGGDLKLLLASEAVAMSVSDYAGSNDYVFKVLIEIDCGEHRTGFEPDDPELVRTAQVIAASDSLTVEGLLTHGGHSYRCGSPAEIADVAEQERQSLLAGQKNLRAAGIDAPVLSSGSTPTAVHGRSFDGLTELRPGVYLAGDLFQWQLGTCAFEDIAITVLSTVIGHDRARNRLVIDAGGLALSKDRSTANSPQDFGYGLLTRVDGSAFDQKLVVGGVHQEHGEVESAAPIPYDNLPLGSFVRVLPNHVCMTAASYDRYYVTDGIGTDIVAIWDKVGGISGAGRRSQ